MFWTMRSGCGTGAAVMVGALCLASCPRALALPESVGRRSAGGQAAEQADSLLFQLQGSGGRGG